MLFLFLCNFEINKKIKMKIRGGDLAYMQLIFMNKDLTNHWIISFLGAVLKCLV